MKFKKNKSISIMGFLFLWGVLFFCGCNLNNEEPVEKKASETSKTIVAVSIVPEKTFVKAVCGDLADVVVMVPPGNSPENYEPTPKEMEKFSQAKLYFSIGVPTESANILPKAEKINNMKIIKLQDEVAEVYDEVEIAPGQRDPHIWLSPKRAKVMVNVIAKEMGELDSKHKEKYEENAKAYIAQLDTLDQDIQKTLQDITNRNFIVFHPAFGYFANDYSLNMYALEQHGKEATPERLQEMIELAKSEKIKAIFYQAEISSKQAQSFAEEVGGKTVQLEPLASNYIENLKNMVETIVEVTE